MPLLTIPDLGENTRSGAPSRGGGVGIMFVKALHVKVGDILSPQSIVVEIETDLVNVEIPATISGKIVHVHVKVGQQVKPGEVLLTLEALD
jgi:pyruvate dehydrogenase E2 component (dihydrolipoamide acetyltransferase)